MSKSQYIGISVFEAAIQRVQTLYEQGHRVIVSFSGGKDSTVCLEIALLAARAAGRLPVEVLMRDEEIMLPGTFEYCERVAARPEFTFHWIYACQPVINVFNRFNPYWWVFDPLLPPDAWVRQPPSFAYKIDDLNILHMISPKRFPPEPEKTLVSIVGVRTAESHIRLMAIHSSKGYLTKPNEIGVRYARPIYDWKDEDVWLAINKFKWDYNTAYDVMARHGRPMTKLRIAPPTMNFHGVAELQIASKAFPRWFDRVCDRLDGVRMAVKYGARAAKPSRNFHETWEDCFKRVCLTDAPDWLKVRAGMVMEDILEDHCKHSNQPFPDVAACPYCKGKIKSWKLLTNALYNGDPFASHTANLAHIEPDFFRPGSGTWGGKPTF